MIFFPSGEKVSVGDMVKLIPWPGWHARSRLKNRWHGIIGIVLKIEPAPNMSPTRGYAYVGDEAALIFHTKISDIDLDNPSYWTGRYLEKVC